MSVKPILPRGWKTTDAIKEARKTFLVIRPKYGKAIPAFNGSQTSRRNRKRPITLPAVDKEVDFDVK